MKKNLLPVFMLSMAIIFSACGDDNGGGGGGTPPNYNPGEIPGLGDQGGSLTGTAYTLPSGVEVNTDALAGFSDWDYFDPWESEGEYEPPAGRSAGVYLASVGIKQGIKFGASRNSAGIAPLNTAIEDIDHVLGSGENVMIVIPLTNNNSTDTKVTFPAGLIIKSESGDYQNGVLMQEEEVTVPANGTVTVLLLMQCGNADKSASSSHENYDFAVVTDADPIKELCSLLAKKKMNFRDYPTYIANKSDVRDFLDEYETQINGYGQSENFLALLNFMDQKSAPEEAYFYIYDGIVQSLLWKLTDDGKSLNSNDKAAIAKMKNL